MERSRRRAHRWVDRVSGPFRHGADEELAPDGLFSAGSADQARFVAQLRSLSRFREGQFYRLDQLYPEALSSRPGGEPISKAPFMALPNSNSDPRPDRAAAVQAFGGVFFSRLKVGLEASERVEKA